MSPPILATKLFVPPPRPLAVFRARLIERLNAGLHHKLTLISAPAGFGKTTLVSEWLAASERPTAWLSLDEGDNDPVRFLSYLVATLQKVTPNIGEGVLRALQSSQPPPIESILTTLLNDITTIQDHFVLVLDDYHAVDAAPVDHALTFLLEHLPPQMHLVITTREDPQLPLSRLRARGQMTELRAADLRFTTSETAGFLKEVMGLDLSAQDIAALEDRTEGWVAGLQLAALSLQVREDIPGFIKAFAGDNRYIADYLVEEVLGRQTEHVRAFLLQTAILDRLNGPLCDAVTGQEGGTARLEALERGNFFVVPLDDKRYWYRYHHLFAEVLAAHLRAEQPEQVVVLHRRASTWYEQHGSATDAIRHALAAEDFDRAAGLVELAMSAMRKSRQEAVLLGWLKALPDEVVRVRPVLSVGYAHVLLSNGIFDGVEDRLRDAERWLGTTADEYGRPNAPAGVMIVVDEEAFRYLPGTIAVARAGRALVLGDVSEAVALARRALDLVPLDDDFWRGAATSILGLASWTSGDLEVAHRTFADGMARLQRAGSISDAIGGVLALADIRIAQGRLREAMRSYERALQLATDHGERALRGTADMYVGIGDLYRERNDLHTARQLLIRSKEQGEYTGFPQNPYRWRVAMARIQQAVGDLKGALDLLHEAERLYVSDFFPNVRPIAALTTRVWVAQGRLAEALGWAREHGLSAHDDLSYLHEYEHITLARVLMARSESEHSDGPIREAIALLHRLLEAAEQGERTGSVIEILIVQALAHQMQGNVPTALESLSHALKLAEPEGYVRIFVDEGRPMAVLLHAVAKQGMTLSYVRGLLAAFPEAQSAERREQNNDIPVQRSTPERSSALMEPLSERERDVLRLLGTDLSGPDIARQLMVSLNTMRTHTKNIYDKLGVNNRRAAVHRAEELDLF